MKLETKEFSIFNLQAVFELIEHKKFVDAEEMIRSLLKVQPNNSDGLWALGTLADKTGQFDQAFQLLGKAAFLAPKQSGPLLAFANFLFERGELEKAQAVFQRAIDKFPSSVHVVFKYARYLLATNQIKSAEVALNRCLEISPYHSGALLSLSELLKEPEAETIVGELHDIVRDAIEVVATEQSSKDSLPVSTSREICELYFASANCNFKRRSHQLAFEDWKKANQYQLSNCEFRTVEMLPFFKKLREYFDQNLLANSPFISSMKNTIKQERHASISPLFIVGMPRAGTTLIEQILTCYPEIETAGETDYIASEVVDYLVEHTQTSYPELMSICDPELLSKAGEGYLSKLASGHANARYVIDKMPANFQSLGLIKLIFPNATILHVTREPRAIAFSIFRNYFAENEPYFCDLEEFALYYHQYQKLIQHWLQMGISMFEIEYENLVRNPKESLEPVISSLGLSWSDTCLAFFQQTTAVHTISRQQVRKPIYDSSIEAWQDFEEELKPFEVALAKYT
ncbi:tetratricopeptide repeat protein [Aliikangiella marina]|uniref:Tetratricopeptide repeat protein n=1 Tax=Aliikangiella marina TaxID=1712262 RepID=A0A545TBY2_9GAMM|nr:sulfotransferase [Aliikangiella marina]TQV74733.1 tetratricopeptide repeat protein [Aliikangiella marina]